MEHKFVTAGAWGSTKIYGEWIIRVGQKYKVALSVLDTGMRPWRKCRNTLIPLHCFTQRDQSSRGENTQTGNKEISLFLDSIQLQCRSGPFKWSPRTERCKVGAFHSNSLHTRGCSFCRVNTAHCWELFQAFLVVEQKSFDSQIGSWCYQTLLQVLPVLQIWNH